MDYKFSEKENTKYLLKAKREAKEYVKRKKKIRNRRFRKPKKDKGKYLVKKFTKLWK